MSVNIKKEYTKYVKNNQCCLTLETHDVNKIKNQNRERIKKTR